MFPLAGQRSRTDCDMVGIFPPFSKIRCSAIDRKSISRNSLMCLRTYGSRISGGILNVRQLIEGDERLTIDQCQLPWPRAIGGADQWYCRVRMGRHKELLTRAPWDVVTVACTSVMKQNPRLPMTNVDQRSRSSPSYGSPDTGINTGVP